MFSLPAKALTSIISVLSGVWKFVNILSTTLNLKPGNNVAISATSGEITISATDTTYSLVSNATASGGIKYITEVSFTNGVLTLESKYLHLN